MESIGVIGIGNMGKGIAANLIKAGHTLTAFKMPTPADEAAAAELQGRGARVTGALSDVFGSVEILVLCLPNSQIVEKLLIGPGSLVEHRSSPVKLVLDFSTSHPDSTKRIAPILETRGIEMLDTPMTGGTLDADRGTIRLIVGGKRSVFEEREGLLKHVAELVMYAGDHGAGNLVKLANNFLAILDQTATAGVCLELDRNNIPRDTYMNFIGASSGNSGGFKLMTSTIVSGDFSLKFGLALAYKDIGYCREVFRFPIADTLHALFKDADANGYHDKDVRTIYSYLANRKSAAQGVNTGGRTTTPIDIGGRLELLVDRHLVDSMNNVDFRLHEPVRQPPARSPLPHGDYGTVIWDGSRYQAYYRSDIAGTVVTGERWAGMPNEITCYAESRDGIDWTCPELDITDVRSPEGSNVILARLPPFSHNFSPFLDARPGVEPDSRFKALAGKHENGLHAFRSADGIHWTRIQDTAVVTSKALAFDSQNVAFWSEAEKSYVCFVRTWRKDDSPQGVRAISRATSPDFVHWSRPVDTRANLPGEQLYTSQTHPYFRAPHFYIAMPMRFTQGALGGQAVEGNNGSSDILLMTMRAGADSYDRTFREVFIRPGPDPKRWERKANSGWLNVVPTGPDEMSMYHVNGDRYTLRTDGFISVRAGAAPGELVTKPIVFAGDALFVNFSTSAAGSLRVEVQETAGTAIPGFALDECLPLVGDSIERRVLWRGDRALSAVAGRPVRLRFVLCECDLYSYRFGKG